VQQQTLIDYLLKVHQNHLIKLLNQNIEYFLSIVNFSYALSIHINTLLSLFVWLRIVNSNDTDRMVQTISMEIDVEQLLIDVVHQSQEG
jgi:hypothetical protein